MAGSVSRRGTPRSSPNGYRSLSSVLVRRDDIGAIKVASRWLRRVRRRGIDRASLSFGDWSALGSVKLRVRSRDFRKHSCDAFRALSGCSVVCSLRQDGAGVLLLFNLHGRSTESCCYYDPSQQGAGLQQGGVAKYYPLAAFTSSSGCRCKATRPAVPKSTTIQICGAMCTSRTQIVAPMQSLEARSSQ